MQERIGSDRFASRHAQTVNWALKTKEVGVWQTTRGVGLFLHDERTCADDFRQGFSSLLGLELGTAPRTSVKGWFPPCKEGAENRSHLLLAMYKVCFEE